MFGNIEWMKEWEKEELVVCVEKFGVGEKGGKIGCGWKGWENI